MLRPPVGRRSSRAVIGINWCRRAPSSAQPIPDCAASAGDSSQLADLASTSTRKIAEAVGGAIISLQAGDSTRQRLEHVCHGLGQASEAAPGLVPERGASEDGARAICQLQAALLRDAQREFGGDIGQIVRALTAILHDAGNVVGHGRTLFGGADGGSSSFLARIKQALAHASTLIATCESAGRSVDEALAIVEGTLAKFRQAIAGLAEATVDITLIGMNAGLKASHLGSRGSAFVVIANELKATADQVSVGAGRLRPVLDGIERSANELKELRVRGDPTQLAKFEPQILQALREVEVGNERLGKLMSRLVDEGAEFEGLMNSAQGLDELARRELRGLACGCRAARDRERRRAAAAAGGAGSGDAR